MGENSKENPENNNVSFLSYLKGLMPLSNNSFKKGIKKVQDRYVLPHDLVKTYLEENKLYADAREKGRQFYTIKYSFGTIDVDRLIEEYTYAEVARKRGDFLKYAFHSNMQIEKILNLFCFTSPGSSIIIPKLAISSTPGSIMDISDILFSWKRGWSVTPPATSNVKRDFLASYANGRIVDLADKKNIFEQFLFSYKTSPRTLGTRVRGTSGCPLFELNTFQILRYFRNFKEHPDATKPTSTNAITQAYFNTFLSSPDLLISNPDVENLLEAYAWLYSEYLKGNITI